jgi:hypothetical protein
VSYIGSENIDHNTSLEKIILTHCIYMVIYYEAQIHTRVNTDNNLIK